jgi:hypothetical protein
MSNTWSRGFVAALTVTFLSSLGHTAVLRVPGDYAAIQQAIDNSKNGDMILVSPGVYKENINFKGKAITVASTNAADPEVVKSTIIHAAAKSSVVTFTTGETSNSILAGFTITGGYGNVRADLGTNIFWGAGVYCYFASPTITGNIIAGNVSPNGDVSDMGYGGGIGGIQSAAIITRNLITANAGYAGGGIMTYFGNARVTSNLIYSNSAAVGGGVVLLSGAQFINNSVVGNTAEGAGNLYAASDTAGQCLITDNIICNATSGGGVYVDPSDDITQMAFNNVSNNTGGDYFMGENRTGVNGNISQDPLFVDAENNDYHLRDVSPCINAGDPNFQPAADELDFYGSARLYARRVDIGASEYSDNFRPLADAGPDQVVTVTGLPAWITLDGSASSDPNGAVLSYHWRQVSGPAVSFSNVTAAKPAFNAVALGTYTFELVVNNGSFSSFPDAVQVMVTNQPPTANAGEDQMYSDLEPIASITLDGSRSFDPEQAPLSYHWKQISGWIIQLSDPTSVKPSFLHPWPGTYLFQLVVNDGLQDSQPDVVAIVIGPNHAPVADAGPSRYVATGNVTLDGTKSFDPDGVGTLTYQWRQLSGPTVTLTGTNNSKPLVSVTPKTTVQKCVFELVVSDGKLLSAPGSVTVTIVPNYGSNVLVLDNPPFDSARPTIVSFGGGNCSTGSGMTFGGAWEQQANWITVNSYGPAYARYGDMLMVYLSSVAPDYKQPIQTIGFSTGNLPAMETARYVNLTYKDARYAVNRVSLLDAVCSNLATSVAQFDASPVAGEQCWVDNYISNDPSYARRPVLPGALNIVCNPARSHGYPVNRYAASSLDYTNGGLTAFAYLSLIGSGKNYQLKTASQKYYFVINSTESIVFFNQSSYPGKILAPVTLAGPADGATIDPQGAAFSCGPVENAVGYQLLLGFDPNRVMDYSIVSDTPTPPQQIISTLPHEHTWWTVRAYDQFGSTIYADPRLIKLPENRPPVADAGPNQVVYAGLDGMATVTLNGSQSTDPDGNALGFTWAWAVGANPYLSNGVSLTIELPVGVHTVQLMVNDGHASSPPAAVNITVVAPLECQLRIAPSTINLNSEESHILASIRFPDGITGDDADNDAPLLLYPGGIQPVKQWTEGGLDGEAVLLFAFFDRDEVAAQVPDGSAELTVVGTLRSGQLFYGRDTVKIIGKDKKH